MAMNLAAAALILAGAGCGQLIPKQLLSKENASSVTWLTDLSQAAAQAQTEKKMILVNFTGSDWCGWCKRLHKEVFAREAFATFATSNLVLVEIDFPKAKPQDAALKRANQELAERYKIQGFPTILLLDSQGRTLGTTGYLPGGPPTFISELKKLSNKSPLADPESYQSAEAAGLGELKLKGISGVPGSRLALINNTTLATGESASVRLGENRVKVRCIAILDETVVVAVDGRDQPVELRLSGRL